MHKYMTAIGFSRLSRRALDEMIHDVINHPDQKRIAQNSEGDSFVELSKEIAENMGIAVCGIYDENGEFLFEYYYPYLKGHERTEEDLIEIEKHSDKEAYAGISDDMHLGVTLVFYLQNVTEYLESIKDNKRNTIFRHVHENNGIAGKNTWNHFWKGEDLPNVEDGQLKNKKSEIKQFEINQSEKNQAENGFRNGAILAALSTEGKIILPIKDYAKIRKTAYRFNEKAKEVSDSGSEMEEAMEKIGNLEMDTYEMISRRVEQREDILSIVSTTFIPDGIETDKYSILGEILEYKVITNTYSKEKIYWMKLNCNGLKFEVCINEKDLLGVPEEGRRFRGRIWMQGILCI